jgi:hypothetical protein
MFTTIAVHASAVRLMQGMPSIVRVCLLALGRGRVMCDVCCVRFIMVCWQESGSQPHQVRFNPRDRVRDRARAVLRITCF